MKYRIKTQEEFIEEFGENRRYRVTFGWNPNMDYLFGKQYPYIINKFSAKQENIKGWNISIDMLIKDEPNYNPKKLIYD
jgi:hypothetical protein